MKQKPKNETVLIKPSEVITIIAVLTLIIVMPGRYNYSKSILTEIMDEPSVGIPHLLLILIILPIVFIIKCFIESFKK